MTIGANSWSKLISPKTLIIRSGSSRRDEHGHFLQWPTPPYDFGEYSLRIVDYTCVEPLKAKMRRHLIPLHDSRNTFWVGAFSHEGLIAAGGVILFKNGKSRLRAMYTEETHRRRGLYTEVSKARIAIAITQGATSVESFAQYPEPLERIGFTQIGVKNRVAHVVMPLVRDRPNR